MCLLTSRTVLPPPLQYNRSYFVSWDAMYVATDVLLTSMGVPAMAGVDSAKHIATFLSHWQEGEQRERWAGRHTSSI